MTERATKAPQSARATKAPESLEIAGQSVTDRKKKALVWKQEDEIRIMVAFLDCMKNGLQFPHNVPQTMQRLKGLIEHDVSRKQMYGKIRKLKNKYKSMVEKLKNPDFRFKNKHEEEMFQLMKSAWGCESDAAEKQQRAYAGKQPEFEQEQSALAGNAAEAEKQQPGKQQEFDQEQSGALAGNAVLNRMETHTTEDSDATKKLRVEITEFSENIRNLVENHCALSTALLENHLKGIRRRSSPGSTTYSSVYELPLLDASRSVSIYGLPLLDASRFVSFYELPLLDASRSQRLHDKWQNQQKLERETNLQRLALLEEELALLEEERSMAKTDMEK